MGRILHTEDPHTIRHGMGVEGGNVINVACRMTDNSQQRRLGSQQKRWEKASALSFKTAKGDTYGKSSTFRINILPPAIA